MYSGNWGKGQCIPAIRSVLGGRDSAYQPSGVCLGEGTVHTSRQECAWGKGQCIPAVRSVLRGRDSAYQPSGVCLGEGTVHTSHQECA